MKRYTCDPNLQLQGNTVQSFIKALSHDNYAHILEEYGLAAIDTDDWYPLNDVLAALSDISVLASGMMDLVSIGMAAAEVSLIPPEAEQMPVAHFYKAYEQLYPTRHRGGDPGTVSTEIIDDRTTRITLDTPYPDDLMYGLFYGFARRLSANGTHFTIRYGEESPRKDLGGVYTEYIVTLE